MKIHIIRKGETMESIAEKYGVSLGRVIRLNKQLANPEDVMQGMKIKIPKQEKSENKQQETETNPSRQEPPKEGLPQDKPKRTLSQLDPPKRNDTFLPVIPEDEHIWHTIRKTPTEFSQPYPASVVPLYTPLTFNHSQPTYPNYYYNPCSGNPFIYYR